MGRIEKTVFISYRRTNVPWALSIYQDLTSHGYDVFFDYQNIDSGIFERVIIENIKARAHFLVILTPSALERCKDPNDWLRREIETAIDEKRNIVPLMLETFEFGVPQIEIAMTGKLSQLSKYNGLRVYSDYFFEGMEKLRNRFLNVALNDIHLQPLSTTIQEITNSQKEAASEIPKIETEQLKKSDANTRLEETLRRMYQIDISQMENERLRIAHELRNNILNPLITLENTLPSGFRNEYNLIGNRLRKFVFDLQPPILSLGLSAGIEELLLNLKNQYEDYPELVTTINNEGNYKYPDNVESHIYFIMQEAIRNAFTHSNAKKITTKLEFQKERLECLVVDDGVGFDFTSDEGVKGLLEKKWFGMVSMFERATLIDARLEISSTINKGTKINLVWTSV